MAPPQSSCMEEVNTFASGFVDDELISIELEDGGVFKVQSAALCHASEYFSKAVRGNFQEATTKKLRLPDCTTESFKLILYWIFNCKLPDFLLNTKQSVDKSRLSASFQLTLTKLWVSGDMLLMGALQNEAMRHLRKILLEFTVNIGAITWAFEFAPLESPLRRAFVQELSRDLISSNATYSSGQKDALGSIPGLMQALFAVGEREILNNHFHMKVPVTRDEDSTFEVKPPAKDN